MLQLPALCLPTLGLPALCDESKALYFPLCDATAAVLADALLIENQQQRVELLRRVLAIDPSLTFWAMSFAAPSQPLRTLADVATALSSALPGALHWSPDDTTRSASLPKRDWPSLAARCVVAATIARKRAIETGEVDAEQAYLRALTDEFRQGAASSESGNGEEPGEHDVENFPASANDTAAVGDEAEQAHDHWIRTLPECAELLPRLSERMARLAELENSLDEVLRTEKMESLYQLAYGAGHEINNPLANISLRAQTLLLDEADPERQRKLAAINRQAFRAHEMIADMMLFARPPEPEPTRMDVGQLLQSLAAEITPLASGQGTRLAHEPADEPMWITADRDQLAVAIRAICVNAIEALGSGGQVEISAGSSKAADTIEVLIADNGPGMDPSVLRHLFDPFYSGREAGRGLGFGLSKAWRIITAHGGQILVDSRVGHGSTFTLFLPVSGCGSVGTGECAVAGVRECRSSAM